ncbi:MAG: carbohydrate-binding family 9-like protein, partial [Armatimonadota bacterium]
HDDRNLYISATCTEPQPERMVAKIKENDRNVFLDDCIEVFLAPIANDKYYHIVVNVIGTVYDALIKDKNWNGSYQVSARKGADNWSLEIAIPFKSLGVDGIKPGTRWGFNICRERYAGIPPEVSSYALLLKSGFHSPSRFRVLEFQ